MTGTFGINCFRTFSVVTETRHRDHEDHVIIYCLAKSCGGGTTQLSTDAPGEDVVLEVTLTTGDILIFRDSYFYHYTSPLQAIGRALCVRDALVMTIDG